MESRARTEKPLKGNTKKKWRHKFLLLAVSCVISLVLAEVLVRLAGNVRNVGPSFTTGDAIYGKRLKKNFSCRRTTPCFSMLFTTNSRGFRGPELPEDLTESIVFIGDSFTMGYGVNDEEEFPSLIRQALDEKLGKGRVPVVNMGMGYNGNGRWVKLLEREVESVDPKVVVFEVCGNDFTDNHNERLFTLSREGVLLELPVPERSLARKLQLVIELIPGLSYSYLVSLMRQILQSRALGASVAGVSVEGHSSESESPSPVGLLTYALIERSVSICQQRGWKVLALSVGVEQEDRRERLRELFGRHGINLVEIPTRSERPDLYYDPDGHWNKAGHRYTAGHLLDRILKLYQL